MRAQLQAQGLTERVAYRLSTPGAADGNLDAEYLLAIDTVADHSLDVCLVSGPAPSACCLASIPKLKPGGLLVLEHADRYLSHNGELTTALEEWQHVVWHLASWRPVWIPNGLSETAIFIKP